MSSENTETIKTHPLQLVNVLVRQLHFVNNIPPQPGTIVEGSKVHFATGHPVEDHKDFVEISVRAAYGIPGIDLPSESHESLPPISLLVELSGFFTKPQDIKAEVVDNFRNIGGLIALTPFLREHVYSLSSRAGIAPIIIPTLQVPMFSEGK